MISKAQIRLIHSLRLAKNRTLEGLYVVEGVKMVSELISLRNEDIFSGISERHKIVKIFALAEWKVPNGIPTEFIQEVEEWELAKISGLTTPNKVLALVEMSLNLPVENISQELILLLDSISDPGNMGTIIRTAEWFGIDRVIASNDSVDFNNPKVVQASMGSIFRVPLHSVDIIRFLEQVSDMPVYGMLFDGEILGKTTLTKNGIVIVGNESHGISMKVQNYITRKLTIEASAISHSESLNASIATAIVCYEFRR